MDEFTLEQLLEEKTKREASRQAAQPREEPSVAAQPIAPMESAPTAQEQLSQIQAEHPFLYPIARAIANSPDASQELQSWRPGLETAKDIAENTLHLPELGAGILQSYADIPISLANTALRPLEAPIPHPDFRGMLNKEPSLGGDIANIGGRILGGVPLASGASGLLNKIPRPTGYAGLGLDALKGGLAGYALGEYGNKGEGRGIGAALGAVAEPLHNLSNTKVAQNISKRFDEMKDKYHGLYGKVFNEAKSKGITSNLKVGSRRLKEIPSKYAKPVKEAMRTGDIEDLHRAQSELGKFIRNQENLMKTTGNNNPIAYENATKLRESIKNSIDESLAKGSSKLAQDYTKTNLGYKKEVVPYSRNTAIQKYNAGEITAKDFVKAIRGGNNSGKNFRNLLAQIHPELDVKQTLGKAAKSIPVKDMLKFASLGAVGYPAGKYFEKNFLGE